MSSAVRSMTLRSTASEPVTETDSRTACSAHSALRPRTSAIPRMSAAASFVIFALRSPSMSSPLPETGCAAPIWVLGAIAAMCPAIVIKVPAEAARAPAGPTKTTTGTSAARKR